VTLDETISDQQLLREFALTQSQRAFRALVERHQSMVFGTARRRMNNDQAAADVAQNVFLALARKAAWLSARTNVGGWLYKSTLMEAARRQRDEMRRGNRERLYAEEMTIRGTSDDDTDAPRAADLMPLLDDALSGLSSADREAIMLRFFRGLSLRDTGLAMGTTEEAARKRVSRALEKLSALFKRRGAAASAALLAGTLLPQAADAAVPAGLAAKVTATASALPATGAAGALFVKAAALTKAQVAAVCLASAAVPVAWQAAELRSLKRENRALLARLDTPPSSGGAVGSLEAGTVLAQRNDPPGGRRPEGASKPGGGGESRRDDHRGRWAAFWETERRQQREARLLAMEERLGLDENQLTAIAAIAEQSDAKQRDAMESARQAGSMPDRAAMEAIRASADKSVAALLTEEQRSAFDRFTADERRNRQEVHAGAMLGDMQKTLLLSDDQKDRLFAMFSDQAAEGAEPGPWAWGAFMQGDGETRIRGILTDEQFRLWKQRHEAWGRMFSERDSGRRPPPPGAP
jgi:RNA polymerase sigma factor (sigma-70 family)